MVFLRRKKQARGKRSLLLEIVRILALSLPTYGLSPGDSRVGFLKGGQQVGSERWDVRRQIIRDTGGPNDLESLAHRI